MQCSSWFKIGKSGRINQLWPGSALHEYTAFDCPPRFDVVVGAPLILGGRILSMCGLTGIDWLGGVTGGLKWNGIKTTW
jgi:hypothetical protein